jgi:hypothetical protein
MLNRVLLYYLNLFFCSLNTSYCVMSVGSTRNFVVGSFGAVVTVVLYLELTRKNHEPIRLFM